MCECVCVCECVRGICFPSYMHTGGCRHAAHARTHKHTLVIFATFGAYSSPSACHSFLTACLSVCLPVLCVCVYISTCLSACSVKSGHQGFFNCFLPPTAPKHCEVEHSSGQRRQRRDRKGKSVKFVPAFFSKHTPLHLHYSIPT